MSLLFTFYDYNNKFLNNPKHIFDKDTTIVIESYFL
jgi:hypothetical protein